ncbi:hypothetical protein PF004_g25102 [Phytophthora fragariae]|uniref:Uncharacterized protein n=1 Tax=Phytophthora fragariae TaxID=53985 RepID=A0A6G0MS96_9STRA|nr:hypothetical protein PF004_g25102 [Phytophthora fragariae]
MPSLASTCNLTIGRANIADQYARINYNYDSSNTNNNYLSFGHNSTNTLIVSNNGYVGIRQTIPACELDIYGNQNIQGNLTFTGASRSLSGLTTLYISGTDASTSSSTGAIQCQGGAYLGASSVIASNHVANGLTLGLGSAGSQSLTNNNVRFWESTLNTQSVNLYRASDTSGGSGSTAPNNIDKLFFNTDTPYTNASYGTAGFTCNGNVFIRSNNSFKDGTSSWDMPLCLSNGNASELLFAFQMNNGPASTSTTSIVMGTVSANDVRFMTNNSTRMTITSAGRPVE